MSNERKGLLFVFVSAAGFGSIPIFARIAYASGANMFEMLSARFILAWVMLFIYQYVVRPPRPLTKRERNGAIFMGLCGYSLASLCFFAALQLVSASLASIMLYTYPAVVSLFLVCLRMEKMDRTKWIALVISFIGLVFVVGGSVATLDPRGIMLALGASLLYSLYILVGNWTLKAAPLVAATAWISLAAGLGTAVMGLCLGQMNFTFGLGGWFAVLGLSLFSTVMAILGFLYGVVWIGAVKASIVSTLEPPLTVLLAFIFLSEVLGIVQLFGGMLILASVLLINRNKAVPLLQAQQTDNPL